MFFNVILDPWLTENQIQFYQWFHDQSHTEKGAAKSIADVEEFCAETERLARQFRSDAPLESAKPASYIDAVGLSLMGTDHTDEGTLMQLPASVLIIAHGKDTMKRVNGWKHFTSVVQAPIFAGDWKETTLDILPEDITISAIQSPYDYSNLHVGIVVTFKCPDNDQPECVIYTPHGIRPTDVSALAEASPPVNVLALLHGCLRVDVGWRFANFTANMGARTGLEVSRALRSKYWVQTHDEAKIEKGLTSWVLSHDWQQVEQVAEEYGKEHGEDKAEVLKKANFHDIGNGGSLVLV